MPKIKTKKHFFLWSLTERMAWEGKFPHFFWCWLLKKLDKQNVYEFDHE